MGSKYPRSVRGCLPLFALALETALILSFFFFTSYSGSIPDQRDLLEAYRGFQDVTVMAALGFGFLNSSLRRHGWSSVAFTLFLLALGVQWAILVDGFLSHFFREHVALTLSSLQIATMSAMSTLISAGAVLGKANLVQLMLMALMEVTAFGTLRMVNNLVLATHIHNAVLAGGVAVGIPGHMILSPWVAMVLGLLAGLFSIGGAKCLPVCLNRVLGIHDTGSVHSTFGLPGLLGGITNLILMMHWVDWTKNSMLTYQLLIYTGVLSLAVAMGLVSGLLTGWLLALKIWKAPHAAKYFDDQAFWKFPHLTVGY
ncbi:blood group Rh(CE) polypeptide isoform X2 [Echinops telfairi]|uniref:Blood group Rh(CE) polypeptide isoform X2 n=1 Tax=Echinops telfairi TaxID=9371 RepID=A0ABM0IQ32_ECHTE|nr:blood group Rh(CE) polypeptide isoform X2 [Echinops telfairi]